LKLMPGMTFTSPARMNYEIRALSSSMTGVVVLRFPSAMALR
jgi:hypothetical protein